ncbi:MAG: winged helix-turn-helix transcriptional regulator [Lachnospiraceae bacterium]|nr:winged helix-turn-helix transcriptional regulator [Lachnospiraceae bacterium]
MKELLEETKILEFGKAISSPIRVKIIKLLSENDGKNFNELAEQLNITGSAITAHINQLEKAGILRVESTSGRHGMQKQCYINESRFLIDFIEEKRRRNTFHAEIPIGSYCSYQAKSTCGLATVEKNIGHYDDPRYFDDPEHIYAGILWLTEGYVEYRLPNYMDADQVLEELQITQELSSEAPGFCEKWPSEIFFSINGTPIGSFICPGDFGLKTGLYSPDWWVYGKNQYGMLKALIINRTGCYLDGQKINNLTIDDLAITQGSEIHYRISAPDTGGECGGLTLYGKGFGNYNQSIKVQMKLAEKVSYSAEGT